MSDSASPNPIIPQRNNLTWRFILSFSLILPVVAAVVLYQVGSFEPAQPPAAAPLRNDRMLEGSEYLALGVSQGPEDLAHDSELRVIYTGCGDGWIKRVTVGASVEESATEDWVNTGGRPLGLALGHDGLIVADAYKGLLKVTAKSIELLTEEVEGKKFKLTDAVDIGDDGIVYFTDASHKYNMNDVGLEFLEGEPNGRFMSYDPVTKTTKLLLSDLYFANGVAVSPDQTHVVFCETFMKRCRKYYIKGEKSGKVEKFIENLPGMPDNIHYDGHGHYLIALIKEVTKFWEVAFRYPLVRKIVRLMIKYTETPETKQIGGIMAVDLEGKPKAEYGDIGLPMITSAIRIEDHLYCGSLVSPYIIRLNVTKHPALK